MYIPKTRSNSTLVSCMPSTERSIQEFALVNLQFSVWSRVYSILVFAGCIFISFSFTHFDAASTSGLIFSSTSTKVGADASSHQHECQCCSLVLKIVYEEQKKGRTKNTSLRYT